MKTFFEKRLQKFRRRAGKKRGQFEVFPREVGDFGIRFRAPNDQVTWRALETFTSDRDARRVIRNLQKAARAPIVTLKPKPAPAPATTPATGSVGP